MTEEDWGIIGIVIVSFMIMAAGAVDYFFLW
jgi:hypothetical protein